MTPGAAELVAGDPFWSVVRRRHPELDIVLLPDEPVGSAAATETVTLTEERVARLDEDAVSLWRSLVDESSVSAARWVAGDQRGVVRREASFALAPVDPVAGADVITSGAGRLRDAGWQVFSPPDGLPRLLASRTDDAGREELQLVWAPTTGRLSLRVRSAGLSVGRAAAHDLLTGSR